MTACFWCSKPLPDEAVFCNRCGARNAPIRAAPPRGASAENPPDALVLEPLAKPPEVRRNVRRLGLRQGIVRLLEDNAFVEFVNGIPLRPQGFRM